jgi:uncharacterized iron-regulated protein
MRRSILAIACAAGALALGGCANTRTPPPKAWEAVPSIGEYTIHSGATGSQVSLDEVVTAAAQADVILLGELHGERQGQIFESQFFRALLAREPRAVAALEFLERDEQVALDDFLSGVTDEAGFVKAADRTPGNYTLGHRDIILASKQAGRPVIAANAPRRYVRMARLHGYERLGTMTPEQSRMFVVPGQMPEGGYVERFLDLMAPKNDAGERPDEENARKMFRSQAMWDATMADSVFKGLNLGRPVVLVVGAFHVEEDGGTVQMLRRLDPNVKVMTVTMRAEGEGGAQYVVKWP